LHRTWGYVVEAVDAKRHAGREIEPQSDYQHYGHERRNHRADKS
jgi:hypothetical protein